MTGVVPQPDSRLGEVVLVSKDAETGGAQQKVAPPGGFEAEPTRSEHAQDVPARKHQNVTADGAHSVDDTIGSRAHEARVAAFIDGIATGLAKLPEGTRASLGADGTSVRLTVARAVTPEEVEACRKAIASVLGHPVLVDVTVEPELIAGLELEAPHAIVRNSFRADLVRLKSELVHHDTDAA